MSSSDSERSGGYGDSDHIFTRDVDTIDVPNRIYALGGGGMQMVLEMFRQDWFAIEAMRDRDRNIDVYLLDTATEHNITQEVDEIEQATTQLEQKLREETDNVVASIKFNYVNITRRYTIQEYADLCGEDVIKDIFSNTDANHWWVSTEHLESPSGGGLYDISKGVIKRRALGKAMHYKAQSQESSYNRIFQGQSDDEVAIFAGIGGGTGSGILLDVAKEINSRGQAAKVTIFSTLPTTRENKNAKANAYAALCELEFLQLSDDEHNPIDDIILLPLEPTQHSRGTTETEDLKEFDAALTYAVCGYYNHPDYDFAFDLGKDYAPFTMAVPQVIHYSRDETAKAKRRALKMLKNKRQILNQEHRIIRSFDNYIENNFSQAETNNIDSNDLNQTAINHLHDRIRDLNRLVNFDLFDLLDFDVVTEEGDDLISEVYNDFDRGSYDVKDVLHERDIEEIIRDLTIYATGQDEDAGLIDDRNDLQEDFVRAILYTEIYRLEQLYERLCTTEKVKRIENDDIAARLLEYLLLPNISSSKGRGRFGPVVERIDELEENARSLESKITDLEDEIEDAKTERRVRINNLTSDWFDDVREDINKYRALSELELEPKIQTLKNKLTEFAGDVESSDDPRLVDKSGVQRALDQIQQAITKANHLDDVEFTEYESIKRDLETLITVREDWNEIMKAAEGSGGFIFGGDPDIEDERGDYTGSQRGLEYFTVASPPATPEDAKNSRFTVDPDYDPNKQGHIGQQIINEKSSVKSRIRTRSQEALDSVEDGSNEEGMTLTPVSESNHSGATGESSSTFDIERKLEQTANNSLKTELKDFAQEAITDKIDDKVPELERQIDDLEQEKEKKSTTVAKFNTLVELYKKKNPDVQEVEEDYSNFRPNLRQGVGQDSGAKGIELTSHFVQRVDPKNIEKAIKKPSLNDPDLLTEGGERHRIKRYLTQLVDERFMKSQYNGLSRNTLSDKDNFTDTGVNFAVMSETVSNDTDYSLGEGDFDFDDSVYNLPGFSQRYKLDSDDEYQEWLVSNSHPWEVGTCIYIQGISFLDNLYGVNESRESYAENYEDQERESTVEEMIARHTHGLNDGYYVRRLDRESVDEDPSLYINNNENEIRELLLDRHEIIHIDEGPSKETIR